MRGLAAVIGGQCLEPARQTQRRQAFSERLDSLNSIIEELAQWQ
jgi:hypothetical protein